VDDLYSQEFIGWAASRRRHARSIDEREVRLPHEAELQDRCNSRSSIADES
jgi:hypothetical protein